MKTPAPCFLVISDDVLLAQKISAELWSGTQLQVLPSVEAALELLRSPCSVAGIVLDQDALRGDVSRGVTKLRSARPLCPLLLVASSLEPSLVNALQAARAQLVVRPLPSDTLRCFIDRALTGGRVTAGDIEQWVVRLSSDYKLSAGDCALIPLILQDESEEHACKRLGLDQRALARGLRRIVRKCRVRNTDRLARNVLRDALLSSRRETREWVSSPKLLATV